MTLPIFVYHVLFVSEIKLSSTGVRELLHTKGILEVVGRELPRVWGCFVLF